MPYRTFPVSSMDIFKLTAAEARPLQDGVRSQWSGAFKSYGVIANGSYVGGDGSPVAPFKPTNGGWTSGTAGLGKVWQRGGIAIVGSRVYVGRVRGRMPANAAEYQAAVKRDFGIGAASIKAFMGGGALLIEDSKAVADAEDLGAKQQFGGGIKSPQLGRATNRVCVGVRSGQTHLILAINVSGAQMQTELVTAGYSSLVVFDGGNTFWAHATNPKFDDTPTNRFQYYNRIAVCVR